LVDEADFQRRRDELEATQQIADLTNPHVQAMLGEIELVPLADRIYGPGSGLIMTAFAFPGNPSRFSDGTRGTYYAASDRDTAIAESRYHDEIVLQGSPPCVVEKTVIEAALFAMLVDVRGGRPCPPSIYDPQDYAAGQAFGALVRRLEGFGVLYDSVRRRGGECAAVFRPPALRNALVVQTVLYEWDGSRIAAVR